MHSSLRTVLSPTPHSHALTTHVLVLLLPLEMTTLHAMVATQGLR